ncbi:DNA polymerase III subunit epsilon [Verminephrobacter aporrectodeae subsp. tuberculatae]|uniref:DNA polymerase III subunit epsilon n=1 Tax=Verminephrobacter aporrectodeae subsp. tuberculatae TaxID=1110392 RepID=A0ABT3KPH2_9BURK|nr:DNA polymerase III subunit epsilon [Verminephrobacter aporrectodeae]MCW5320226.1 DNA polymerase III subunit epsilon [Verminephrobacter aporrectodeae subsp. tuberculatae]
MSRQIVLDTETTGLSADNGDRIIELGCVELLNRRLTGNNLHLFFNPDRDSHEDALKVHGISNEFLKDKPRFAEVVERVIEYLRGAEVIIHNAAFDLGFLDKELALTGRPAFRTHIASVTDTLAMAREMYPGKRNSLDALCERLGVNNSGRILHGALLDAELLADVYIHLTRGQDALLIADDAQESAHGLKLTAIDLRALVLPVVHASAQEQAAHAEVLAQIDKASGGKTIWRSLGSVP